MGLGLALGAEEAVAGFLFQGSLALDAGAALLAQLLGLVELGGFAQGEGAAQVLVELALLAQQRLQVGGLGIEVALTVAHELALLQEPRGLAGEELGGRRGTDAREGQRVSGGKGRTKLGVLGGQVLEPLPGLLELTLGLGLAAAGELELQAEAPQLLLGVGLGAPAQRQDERGDLRPPGASAKGDTRARKERGRRKKRRSGRSGRGRLRLRRVGWRFAATHFFHYA